tara:strand:- start:123 stop:578 length:456 start_codon:yes stop_codon:yes gene_type:complete
MLLRILCYGGIDLSAGLMFHKVMYMKSKFLLLTLFFSITIYANTKDCINYKNLESNLLSGELKVMSSTMFFDHGDIINHYIFVIDENTCFSTEYGDWDVKEVQVILSEEQLQKIDQIANKKIVMEIEDYIVGETQHWKRRIGILKAKFRVG